MKRHKVSDTDNVLEQHIISNEMQEDSRIHNKLLYWIKYATKTTCFGPLLWGHLQV